MILLAQQWIATRIYLVAAIVGVCVTVGMWDHARLNKAETRGAEKAVAKVTEATNNAAQLGAKAAAKSLSGAPAGGVRGVRLQTDPTTRND